MKPVITLTLVGIISAALLAMVSDMTREPIAAAKAKMKREAIEDIFPFKIDSLKTLKTESGTFYEAIGASGELKGVAVEAATEKGYSGKIEILLGVSTAAKIYGYKVLSHAETPGLGDKITKPRFKEQFRNKDLNSGIWKVKKDGGFVDELTAATISSRAITDAVHNGLEMISKQYPNLSNQ
ncbi:electron transport complex, RnfABCDGE type, G subunit [Chloroherpeton thalassium ATCC 35110]|uniref:Ion-translocating oxidoreductase complex subunit G n=1 Tax=Chloroherpeton thalassium (strain ATCC 35110 / GB-78) TaxID=517418 RepID=B3QTB3_CHLT3|nr:RnfABCDGE type electron transport complex subunit G [Chloroherpeton thalassium]ACF14212.1 electron transport complex, RnfABCDGE type, G subunit [Chloroherpeton thalassium ATCC 35110]